MSNFITPIDPDLERIAAAIRCRTAHAALDVGQLLIGAKAKAAHGEWGPFLERAGLRPRTAQDAMRLARAVDDGELSAEVLDRVGMKAALRQIAKPKNAAAAHLAEIAEYAVEFWEVALEAYAGDAAHGRILQSFPDGPPGVIRWLRWGDAVLANDQAAAWEARPWVA